MEGMQKRKACSEPAPEASKWTEEITYCGDGRYVMLPWDPCPQFRKSSSAYAQDPQPLMRMSIGLSVTKRILTALDALAHEMQPAKKTRSGVAFEAGKDDSKTVKHLRICGGWPDWEADYDHNGAARKDYNIKNALCLQQQLGAGIAIFSELESLILQNMQWYVHKNKQGVKLFFVNLRKCAKLTKLALVNNTCGGCFLDAIIPEVLPLPLRVLDLRGNRLYREDMYPEEGEIEARERAFVELLGTLGECKTLVQLSLADMNLEFGGLVSDDMTTRMVIRLMQELPSLNTLDLRDNEITELGKAVLEAAKPAALVLVFE
jgi:hypothetical protein